MPPRVTMHCVRSHNCSRYRHDPTLQSRNGARDRPCAAVAVAACSLRCFTSPRGARPRHPAHDGSARYARFAFQCMARGRWPKRWRFDRASRQFCRCSRGRCVGMPGGAQSIPSTATRVRCIQTSARATGSARGAGERRCVARCPPSSPIARRATIVRARISVGLFNGGSMKVEAHTPLLPDTPQHATRAADAGSDNAFGQLLSSLERDMWSGLSQLQAERETPSSMPSTAKLCQRLDDPDPVGGTLAATESAPGSSTFGTVYASLVRKASDTARTDARSGGALRCPSDNVHMEFAAPPPRPDTDQRAAPRPDSRSSQPRPSKATTVRPDIRQSTSEAPFRVTVTETAGAIAIALRTHRTRPDELDALESQAIRALGRYGVPAATLCINGVDRQIYAAGGEKNGH